MIHGNVTVLLMEEAHMCSVLLQCLAVSLLDASLFIA